MTRADTTGTEATTAGATPGLVPTCHRLRGRLDLRFVDEALENGYRAFFLHTDKRHAILAIGVFALLKASFAVVDVMVQPPGGLSAVLAVRFAFVAVCLLTMGVLSRVRRHGQYDALVFGWAVLVVASNFYTIAHRPPNHFGFLATSPMLVLMFFAFFRNRFELQLLASVLVIAGDFFTAFALREPAGMPLPVQVCITYAIALLVGIIVSRQLKYSRRTLYGALLSEREMAEAMRELAFRDDLTGVLNRRSFLQEAGARWREAGRGQHTIRGCVLILDLDHFKVLNDQHGHEAGDQALVLFARMVETIKREEDVFGRIGGEEFALLLPGMDLAQAEGLADAVTSGCRALQVGRGGPLSVSIGVAAIAGSDANLAATMLRADRAMYCAKALGRGRSCTAESMDAGATRAARSWTSALPE